MRIIKYRIWGKFGNSSFNSVKRITRYEVDNIKPNTTIKPTKITLQKGFPGTLRVSNKLA